MSGADRRDPRAEQRRADELRAKYEISYEEALKRAVARGTSYVAAVQELAAKKKARGRG